jgi:hypothetical protein
MFKMDRFRSDYQRQELYCVSNSFGFDPVPILDSDYSSVVLKNHKV